MIFLEASTSITYGESPEEAIVKRESETLVSLLKLEKKVTKTGSYNIFVAF